MSAQRDLISFLSTAREADASDLHLTAGAIPFGRIHGLIERFEQPPLTDTEAESLIGEILELGGAERKKDLDLTIDAPNLGRFRVNIHHQRRGWGAALRCIPRGVPDLDDLQLPDSLHTVTQYRVGMVLVTGPTGSGKSSTLAALVSDINRTRKQHVVTIEDPIEFVFQGQRCNVTQREVGTHTNTFYNALRAALREDPDVIMVAELRDLETIRTAIVAAETGHLVLGTLHTRDAASTVNRLLDVFPPGEADQVRTMVAASLRTVISQRLLPRKGGGSRVPAYEILNVTPAVAKQIRDGRTHQLPSLLQIGRKQGMIDLDTCLTELLEKGLITEETARSNAKNPARFGGGA